MKKRTNLLINRNNNQKHNNNDDNRDNNNNHTQDNGENCERKSEYSNSYEENIEDYPFYSSDSTIEDIEIELNELESFIKQLNLRREEYQQKSALINESSDCSACNSIDNQQLQRCLHNLCGRIKVLQVGEEDNRNNENNET